MGDRKLGPYFLYPVPYLLSSINRLLTRAARRLISPFRVRSSWFLLLAFG
jgi:hypothetical protein